MHIAKFMYFSLYISSIDIRINVHHCSNGHKWSLATARQLLLVKYPADILSYTPHRTEITS